ncbi:hypothetical protein HRG_013198 [Hirsutella rhossiliensis]
MPIYVRPPSRPRLVSTCDLLPQLCQKRPFHRRALFCALQRIPGHCRPPAHGDGRDNRLPHTSNHTLQPFQHHPTNLAHQFTINTRQSASSSNSHKAAGDNMSMTSLMQPDYPSRFAPSPAPMSHQRP